VRSLEEINQELDSLKQQLDSVQGTETEVYTRIVGYYRSLKNWNKGKREEYDHRRTYEVDADAAPSRADAGSPAARTDATDRAIQGQARPVSFSATAVFERDAAHAAEPARPAETRGTISYRYFFRIGCSGCGPVKDKLAELGLPGTEYDVDTEEGFAMAKEYEIMATPTVIFYNPDGSVRGRVSSVRDIDPVLV